MTASNTNDRPTVARRAGPPIVAIRAGLAATVLASVLVAALITAVVLGARDRADESAAADNRTTLRAQAGGIVASVFSVDQSHWQADRARARHLVAGQFAESFAAQLRRGPEAGTASVRWRPGPVALTAVTVDTGTALIPVHIETRTETGAQSDQTGTVRAGFDLRAGQWLLTDLEVLR